MGGAWVASTKVIPLIVEPINYRTVGVLQETKQIEKLLDGKSLDILKDIIQKNLEIPISEIKSDLWTAKKTEFLFQLKAYLEENPPLPPLDRDAFYESLRKTEELNTTLIHMIAEKKQQTALIEELKKLKNKAEVSLIEQKFGVKNTDFENFLVLCQKVTDAFGNLSSILNGIVFKSYTNKKVDISITHYTAECSYALAQDYINNDLEVEWKATSKVQNILNSLIDLDKFIQKKGLTADFFENFEESYEAPLDINNLDFWTEVLNLNVRFE
jgi:hypothetical protein